MIRRAINQLVRSVIIDFFDEGSVSGENNSLIDYVSSSMMTFKDLRLRSDALDVLTIPIGLKVVYGRIGVLQLDGIMEGLLNPNMRITVENVHILLGVEYGLGLEYSHSIKKAQIEFLSKFFSSQSSIHDLIYKTFLTSYETSFNKMKYGHLQWKIMEHFIKHLEIIFKNVHIRLEILDGSDSSESICDSFGILFPIIKITSKNRQDGGGHIQPPSTTGITNSMVTNTSHLSHGNLKISIKDMSIYCDPKILSYGKLSSNVFLALTQNEIYLKSFTDRLQSDVHMALIYPLSLDIELNIKLNEFQKSPNHNNASSNNNSNMCSFILGQIVSSISIQILSKLKLTIDNKQLDLCCKLLFKILSNTNQYNLLLLVPSCCLQIPIPLPIHPSHTSLSSNYPLPSSTSTNVASSTSGTLNSTSASTASSIPIPQKQSSASAYDPYFSLFPVLQINNQIFPRHISLSQLQRFQSATMSPIQQYILRAPTSIAIANATAEAAMEAAASGATSFSTTASALSTYHLQPWTRVAWQVAYRAVTRDLRLTARKKGLFREGRRWCWLAQVANDRKTYAQLFSQLLRVSGRTGQVVYRTFSESPLTPTTTTTNNNNASSTTPSLPTHNHGLHQSELCYLHDIEMRYPSQTILVFRRFATAYAVARHIMKTGGRGRSALNLSHGSGHGQNLKPEMSWKDVVRLVTALIQREIETQTKQPFEEPREGVDRSESSVSDTVSVYSRATSAFAHNGPQRRGSSKMGKSGDEHDELASEMEYPDSASVMNEEQGVRPYTTPTTSSIGSTTNPSKSPSHMTSTTSSFSTTLKASSMFSSLMGGSSSSTSHPSSTSSAGKNVSFLSGTTASMTGAMKSVKQGIKSVLQLETNQLDDLDIQLLGIQNKKHFQGSNYGPLWAHFQLITLSNSGEDSDDESSHTGSNKEGIRAISLNIEKFQRIPTVSNFVIPVYNVVDWVLKRHRRILVTHPIPDITITIPEVEWSLRTPVHNRQREVYLTINMMKCRFSIDATTLAQSHSDGTVTSGTPCNLGLVQIRFDINSCQLLVKKANHMTEESGLLASFVKPTSSAKQEFFEFLASTTNTSEKTDESLTSTKPSESEFGCLFESAANSPFISGSMLLDFARTENAVGNSSDLQGNVTHSGSEAATEQRDPSHENIEQASALPFVSTKFTMPMAVDVQIQFGKWILNKPFKLSEAHVLCMHSVMNGAREIIRLSAISSTGVLLLEKSSKKTCPCSITPLVFGVNDATWTLKRDQDTMNESIEASNRTMVDIQHDHSNSNKAEQEFSVVPAVENVVEGRDTLKHHEEHHPHDHLWEYKVADLKTFLNDMAILDEILQSQRIHYLSQITPRILTVCTRLAGVTVELSTKDTLAALIQSKQPLGAFQLWWLEYLNLNGMDLKEITLDDIRIMKQRQPAGNVESKKNVLLIVEPTMFEVVMTPTPEPSLLITSPYGRLDVPIDRQTIFEYLSSRFSLVKVLASHM